MRRACLEPVVLEARHVRWCYLEEGHCDDQHETIFDQRTYRWRADERSTTP